MLPGDSLVTDVELIATKGNIGKVKATARVDDEVAAEGEFMFALVSRDTRRLPADKGVETKKKD